MEIEVDDMDEEVPPDEIDVEIAIDQMKNNRAPGPDAIQAETFKLKGQNFISKMKEILNKIWTSEKIPEDWREGVICPIHKKGDRLSCSNYRGITLLNIAYKVFAKVLCNRLKHHVEEKIGVYQCGFRPGKSTVDQIFTLRQIMEK